MVIYLPTLEWMDRLRQMGEVKILPISRKSPKKWIVHCFRLKTRHLAVQEAFRSSISRRCFKPKQRICSTKTTTARIRNRTLPPSPYHQPTPTILLNLNHFDVWPHQLKKIATSWTNKRPNDPQEHRHPHPQHQGHLQNWKLMRKRDEVQDARPHSWEHDKIGGFGKAFGKGSAVHGLWQFSLWKWQ